MNDAGLKLIKEFEGCVLTAYLCPAGAATIGYGHTGPDVDHSDVGVKTITQEQADDILLGDIAVVESRVKRAILVPYTTNELAALTSFAYNLGVGNLRSSTLLRLFNLGASKAMVAGEFPRWNKVNGKPCDGLTRRRRAEADLFMTPEV